MEPATLVVVDKDKDTAEQLRPVFEGRGYTVTWARTLRDARAVIGRLRPTIVVLERNLPDGDGLALCSSIKDRPQTSSIPVMFLAYRGDVGHRITGLKAGGDDYMAKPFNLDELVARMDAILRNYRLRPATSSEGSPGP